MSSKIDGIDFDTLMEGEWATISREKVLQLKAELKDWAEARERGGYDTRLLTGAITVCEEYLLRVKD